MTINPGLLFFCIIDSVIAFFLVFFVTRSKFGGAEKTLARVLASVFGTIVFTIYFGVLIWFNTASRTISYTSQIIVYALPIVLSILMIVLTLLSQPPKKAPAQDSELKQEEMSTAEETDTQEE